MVWPGGKAHMLYLISSNLVDDSAINAITAISFNPYGRPARVELFRSPPPRAAHTRVGT